MSGITPTSPGNSASRIQAEMRRKKSPAEAVEKRIKFLGVSRFEQRKTYGRGRKTPARAMRVIPATLPAPSGSGRLLPTFCPVSLVPKGEIDGAFFVRAGRTH